MNTQKFEINEIIKRYNLDIAEVADVLFPSVRYRKQALERILRGEASLNTEQLYALAKHVGVLVSDFFTVSSWKASTENGTLIFNKDEYKVKINYGGAWLSVYKNNELIKQEMFTPSLTLEEFINHINNLIKNYENEQL